MTGEQAGADGRVLVSIAAVIIILAAMRAAATLVVAVAIAFVVTALAAPLQARLIRAGWPRVVAFVVILGAALVPLAAIFWVIDLSLSAFIADLPAYRPGAVQLLADVLALGRVLRVDLTHLVDAAKVVQSAFTEAGLVTRAFLSSIAGWTLVLTVTGFMLFEALDYPEKGHQLIEDPKKFGGFAAFTRDLSRFMGIATVGALLTAAGDLLVLFALGIPSALLWAALAFLLSYVPNIGSIIIVIPPTIATLVRFGFARAMLVLVLMLLVDNLVGVVVIPRLVGKRLAISPFWGLLSLLFWGWLFGPIGAILAVPMTMFAKFLLETSPSTAKLGRAMAPLWAQISPEGGRSAERPA